ncbi:MAG: winged helix-turn-helix transcriptional regulator [Lachnospiraceae bacterium]|nr:winged helix-turn-helix transcriptional regulator [Lachnospiraceae bacterium]
MADIIKYRRRGAMFVNNLTAAYNHAMSPLCEEVHLKVHQLNMLQFLEENPETNTAKDICRCLWMKPGLVSMSVDELVEMGYLVRESVSGDRRKVRLTLTEKAKKLTGRILQMQSDFIDRAKQGLTDQEKDQLEGFFDVIFDNIDQMSR